MTKTYSKRLVASLILFVVLSIGIIIGEVRIGPAVIRGAVVPFYVTATYKPGFDHTFRSDFSPVNKLLTKMDAYPGIEPVTVLNSCNHGDDVQYSGIQESVLCQHTQTTYGIKPTPSFVSNWKNKSPALEVYLLAHKWKKEDRAQTITKLFDNLAQARWINYSKVSGKTACHLYILYNGGGNTAGDNKLYTMEYCDRSVDFFGGY